MKKLKQTILHKKFGNCFSTCIASLFDLKIEDVPNFCAHDDWWKKLQDWLRPQNLAFIELPTNKGVMPPLPILQDGMLCLAVGTGPRGCLHAVIIKYKTDGVKHWFDLEHDPHPSDAGIFTTDFIGWFIVVDPSKPIRGLI